MTNKRLPLCSVLFYAAAVAASVVLVLAAVAGYRRAALRSVLYHTDAAGLKPAQLLAPVNLKKLEPVEVTFTYQDKAAGQVSLHGAFNNWGEREVLLERAQNGGFKTTLLLPKGEYHYYYRVDGVAVAGPKDARRVEAGGKTLAVKAAL
ncbi:MAG: hypothetical protein LBR90_02665 [Elusimicrobiota bacterium]|jgi:hypothetical protein|nr:hypothetical protein [Elusimicrobiota bacterium]